MSDADYPVLYVMVRTDLQSMSNGKSQAHSGHAANAFTKKMFDSSDRNDWYSIRNSRAFNTWYNATPQGFGTQINLKAPWDQVLLAVESAERDGFCADIVYDPTYPYYVNEEILPLMNKEIHSLEPQYLGEGRYCCFRNEATAAYIFGDKSDVGQYVSSFPLHP